MCLLFLYLEVVSSTFEQKGQSWFPEVFLTASEWAACLHSFPRECPPKAYMLTFSSVDFNCLWYMYCFFHFCNKMHKPLDPFQNESSQLTIGCFLWVELWEKRTIIGRINGLLNSRVQKCMQSFPTLNTFKRSEMDEESFRGAGQKKCIVWLLSEKQSITMFSLKKGGNSPILFLHPTMARRKNRLMDRIFCWLFAQAFPSHYICSSFYFLLWKNQDSTQTHAHNRSLKCWSR